MKCVSCVQCKRYATGKVKRCNHVRRATKAVQRARRATRRVDTQCTCTCASVRAATCECVHVHVHKERRSKHAAAAQAGRANTAKTRTDEAMTRSVHCRRLLLNKEQHNQRPASNESFVKTVKRSAPGRAGGVAPGEMKERSKGQLLGDGGWGVDFREILFVDH